jgi:hypothetical protein
MPSCWRIADGGRVLVGQGVKDADGVGLVSQFGDVRYGSPAEWSCLVAGHKVPSGDLAPKDEGDDPPGDVLVHAGVTWMLTLAWSRCARLSRSDRLVRSFLARRSHEPGGVWSAFRA